MEASINGSTAMEEKLRQEHEKMRDGRAGDKGLISMAIGRVTVCVSAVTGQHNFVDSIVLKIILRLNLQRRKAIGR